MLVIIDIQPVFEKAAVKCMAGIQDAVRTARRTHMPISVIEYVTCGSTIPYIWNMLPRGTKAITKYSNDGAEALLHAMGHLEQPLYLCGVNGLHCVRETAEGLTNLGCKPYVIRSATADIHDDAWFVDYKKKYKIPLIEDLETKEAR